MPESVGSMKDELKNDSENESEKENEEVTVANKDESAFFIRRKIPKVIKQKIYSFTVLLYSKENVSVIIDPRDTTYKLTLAKLSDPINNFLDLIIDTLDWILMEFKSSDTLVKAIISIHTDCIPGINMIREWIHDKELEPTRPNKDKLNYIHSLLMTVDLDIQYTNIIRNIKLEDIKDGTPNTTSSNLSNSSTP